MSQESHLIGVPRELYFNITNVTVVTKPRRVWVAGDPERGYIIYSTFGPPWAWNDELAEWVILIGETPKSGTVYPGLMEAYNRAKHLPPVRADLLS